jgi:hypothetical protein
VVNDVRAQWLLLDRRQAKPAALQRCAACCNAQRDATRSVLQRPTHNVLQRTTCCNSVQRAARQYNRLQRSAMWRNRRSPARCNAE